jgi:hypothetical protein
MCQSCLEIDRQIEEHRKRLKAATDHAEVERIYRLIAQLYGQRVRKHLFYSSFRLACFLEATTAIINPNIPTSPAIKIKRVIHVSHITLACPQLITGR